MSVTAPKKIARYQVLNHIETGGMGSVFLARDPAIDRLVAIKLLREGFDNPELRERFVREARSAGRLRHINIVTIFDVGEHENAPFIAMEYVEGETLSALIRRKAEVSLARKLHLMDELCAGLHFAHRAGIVHRDIKPKNIMVDSDGVLKVLDFGIARVSDAGAGAMKTQAGMLMGTLNYMAPEQMMGQPDVDARADIFAAGAVFYELLTGKQAFPGGLENGILHKIINVNPEPLQVLEPHLDAALVEVVNRCLEKSREQRYPDMAAVRRHLLPLRRRHPIEEEESASQTTLVKPAGPRVPDTTVRPKSTGSRDTTELDRLRAEQIQAHLEDARTAFEAGDYTVALAASQRVLLLNGENPEALELEAGARAGLDALRIDEWLRDAREELARGALTSASLLVSRALALNASSPEASAVQRLVDEARRQLEETQNRARALDEALAGAREDLSAGALDAAARRVDEALAINPRNDAARLIQREILDAVTARSRADDEARARAAVQTSRELFANGDHPGALAALERFKPASLVVQALNELRAEFAEIERRRIEAERQTEDRRKAAEAAERVAKATARKLNDAATRLQAQDLDGARALIRDLLAQQPQHSDVRALEAKIEQAIERKRPVTAGLATARSRLDAGLFEEARRAIADVEAMDAAAPDLVTLRRAADAGIRAAEAAASRKRDVDERVEEATRAFDSRELATAQEQLASALKIDAGHAQARALQAKVLAAIETQRVADRDKRDQEQRQLEDEKKQREQERRQREAQEKRAREEAVAARQAALQKQRDNERAERAQREARPPANPDAEGTAEGGTAKPLGATVVLTKVSPGRSTVLPPIKDRTGPALERPRALKYTAVAVAVMAVVGLILWGLPRTPPPPAPEVVRGGPAASVQAKEGAAPSGPQPSATDTPTSQSPPKVAEPVTPLAPRPADDAPTVDNRAAQLKTLGTAARKQWQGGEIEQALRTVDALKKLPSDREWRGLAAEFLRYARDRAEQAASAAREAQAQSTTSYAAAQERQREATRLERADRFEETVRAHVQAADLFIKATTEVRQVQVPPVTPPPIIIVPKITDPPPPARPREPAPQPAESKSPTPVPQAVNEEESILGVLQTYRQAYERLDAAAINRLQPGLAQKQLASMFAQYRSFAMTITNPRVSVAGNTAVVTCTVTTNIRPTVGRTQSFTRATTFRLQKAADSWIVVERK